MNIIKIGNKIYKYESVWRKSFNDKTLDSKNKPFPWPTERNTEKFLSRDLFLDKLNSVQKYLLKKKKFIKYDKSRKCIFNDDEITTGLYELNNIRWENSLIHYIKKHNVKPTDEFIDFIFRYDLTRTKPKITKINGIDVVKSGKKYLKLERNQILIMDALLKHGGFKIYKDNKDKNIYRYSEHAGLLDFNNFSLEKIIISGNTNRVDALDEDIFLPKNMIDAFDYEYLFHTHPPTPFPGGRVTQGILYEFPSISDLFHFMDHYNEGKTQGSIVISAEGMYIIRKKNYDNKKIIINEDNFYHETNRAIFNSQREAIKLYGTQFSQEFFFSVISQNTSFINEINKILNKYQLHIDFYPRIKDDNNNWIIDSIYLPVYVIEPKT